jgi:hypothetical protein
MKKIVRNYLVIFLLTFTNLTVFSQSWSAMQTGAVGGAFNNVDAIINYNGNIVIGGEFTTVSGVPATRVAKWNGSSWQAMGSGLPDVVKCLAIYNNVLYAGTDGTGSNLYYWTGSAWTAVSGFGAAVYALYTDTANNLLYAGGKFTSPGTFIAKYNGSTWTGVGSGLNVGSLPAVFAVTTFKDTLYVGGSFSPATKKYLAKWNGTSWVAPSADMPNNAVRSFSQHNDTLYVGGDFTKFGTNWVIGVAKSDGRNFWNLAQGTVGPQYVSSVSYYNGDIYATGSFANITGGTSSVNMIARWNRYYWDSLGTGLNQIGYALANINDTLFVGGQFTTAGGNSSASLIARWYNPFIGCSDTAYFEGDFDVDIARVDSCKTLKVRGCTDPNYLEYNPAANIYVPGSCQTFIVGVKEVPQDNYSLSVSPNPYAGKTTINLSLTSSATVNAEIYNVIGSRITSINSGNLSAGEHKFYFSAAELGFAPGAYFLRLEVDGKTKYSKLIEFK